MDERERLLAQHNEMATLAGGLAHEIRNPLSTIRMNLGLLAEELDGVDDPSRKRMLLKVERIQQETRHLEGVLDAFLQFARAGELELADVPPALKGKPVAFLVAGVMSIAFLGFAGLGG